jgi:hypothetical protein
MLRGGHVAFSIVIQDCLSLTSFDCVHFGYQLLDELVRALL